MPVPVNDAVIPKAPVIDTISRIPSHTILESFEDSSPTPVMILSYTVD